jgi:hypothetical protein
LKRFVLFVYLPEFLFSVVFNYVADIDLGCFEEGLGFFGICVISHFNLLALDLNLLWLRVINLDFFMANCGSY